MSAVDRTPNSSSPALLDDVLAPGLRVVFCGTALGAKSAQVRAYYAGPGNQFWAVVHEVGLTPRRLDPQEYPQLLDHGIGLTDVCKTRSGSDQAVGQAEFDVARLLAKIEEYQPKWLAFNGKNAARAALDRPVSYGRQPEVFGTTKTFVLPSTSGAARGYWDPVPWRELAELAGKPE